MLTIDEQEARAYQAGDLALADALAHLADARTEIDTLRALVTEAVDYVTDAAWCERAQAAPIGASGRRRRLGDRAQAALED